jgi:hypothetical protein
MEKIKMTQHEEFTSLSFAITRLEKKKSSIETTLEELKKQKYDLIFNTMMEILKTGKITYNGIDLASFIKKIALEDKHLYEYKDNIVLTLEDVGINRSWSDVRCDRLYIEIPQSVFFDSTFIQDNIANIKSQIQNYR